MLFLEIQQFRIIEINSASMRFYPIEAELNNPLVIVTGTK